MESRRVNAPADQPRHRDRRDLGNRRLLAPRTQCAKCGNGPKEWINTSIGRGVFERCEDEESRATRKRTMLVSPAATRRRQELVSLRRAENGQTWQEPASARKGSFSCRAADRNSDSHCNRIGKPVDNRTSARHSRFPSGSIRAGRAVSPGTSSPGTPPPARGRRTECAAV